MCLKTKTIKPYIAEEDIKVYKVLRRETTINLPDKSTTSFKAPDPDDFKVKFYDRSNSNYQKQIYFNGKYLGTTIAPTKDYEDKIIEVLFILFGLGLDFEEIKRIFKETFRAN